MHFAFTWLLLMQLKIDVRNIKETSLTSTAIDWVCTISQLYRQIILHSYDLETQVNHYNMTLT